MLTFMPCLKRCALGLGLWAALGVAGAAPDKTGDTEDFLAPELAFALTVKVEDAGRLSLNYAIAPGYYLYRDRIEVAFEPQGAQTAALQLPRGEAHFDTTFRKSMEVFRDHLQVSLPVRVSTPTRFEVSYQGCAEKGLCYQPMHGTFQLTPTAAGGLQLTALTDPTAEPEAAAVDASSTSGVMAVAPIATAASDDDAGQFAKALASGSLWRIGGVFLLAGLFLALTPCVLPMIPILSAIIVGQGAGVSRMRGFSLALAYALGMALVYTAFGMLAGLAGEGLAGALQQPAVLCGFALLLSVLALSMFGVYELQMPAVIQNRVLQASGQLNGGRYVGVFLMGGLSALIVGPCVAAPLAGALVYISQTRDVVIGGVALFALASGMSVPLLLVGASAGSLLPKTGAWMERVKHLFGALLLAVAVWMVAPVLPPAALMGLCALGLIIVAVYLGAFERLPDGVGLGRLATKGLGLAVATVAVLEMAGVASGGRDVLQPLSHWAGRGAASTEVARTSELQFQPVATVAALDAAIQQAKRPVLVDFYADWCVSCKEMESLTFTDPQVRSHMARMTLLRADVTADRAEDRALMKRFGLFGPPAILFFDAQGSHLADAKVIGYLPPDRFLRQVQKVSSGPL